MESLVVELQREALSNGISVTELLMKAKVLASNLGLDETERWIGLEADGYREEDDLPRYRYVHGELRTFHPYVGWETVQFEGAEDAAAFAERAVYQPVVQLEDLLSHNERSLTMTIPPGAKQKIIDSLSKLPHDVRYFVDRSQFVRLVFAVRQRIIDWTTTLVKNDILGKGMVFSPQERQQVEGARNIYNVNIGGNVSGNVGDVFGQATINAQQTIQGVDPEALQVFLSRLRELLRDAQFEDSGAVERDLSKLEEEAASGEPRKKTVVETLRRMLSPIGKAAGFAGRVAAEHEIGSYLDGLGL